MDRDRMLEKIYDKLDNIEKEVRLINSRVTTLEADQKWHDRIFSWGQSSVLVGLGIGLKFVFDWIATVL